LGDYDIEVEYIDQDKDGFIYVAGAFSGNETFERQGIEAGYYKNAKLNGSALPETPINPGIQQPSQAAFITCLKPDLSSNWVKTYTGQAHVIPRSLSVGDKVYMTAMYMHLVRINGNETKAHKENNSMSD